MHKMISGNRLQLTKAIVSNSNIFGSSKVFCSINLENTKLELILSKDILTDGNFYTIDQLTVDEKCRIMLPKKIISSYNLNSSSNFLIFLKKDLTIGIIEL